MHDVVFWFDFALVWFGLVWFEGVVVVNEQVNKQSSKLLLSSRVRYANQRVKVREVRKSFAKKGGWGEVRSYTFWSNAIQDARWTEQKQK